MTSDAASRGFLVPQVEDNVEGWGPCSVPEHLKDLPYAPFTKADKIGRAADFSGLAHSKTHYGRHASERHGDRGATGASVFNIAFQDGEDSYKLVDNKPVPRQRFGPPRRFQQRFQRRERDPRRDIGPERETISSHGKDRPPRTRRGNFQRFGRWNRENGKAAYGPSIEVGPKWKLLQQIQFATLMKLNVPEPEVSDLVRCGQLGCYDKAYDRVTPKFSRKLQRAEDLDVPSVTTSDDPVIQQLKKTSEGNVFATDKILSCLMCAPRSAYSWDLIVTKAGEKLFFDKRDEGNFDLLTVHETAQEMLDEDKSPGCGVYELGHEATMINRNFFQQVIVHNDRVIAFEETSPFGDEQSGSMAKKAYRYRKWNIDEATVLIARCELDGFADNKGQDALISVKALNEFDPKATGVDWRQKLENQRGAILATELKNNANKLARWTAEALLSGADQLRLGYVSRAMMKDNSNHVILGTQMCKPNDFAAQINLKVGNMWGIFKSIVDLCRTLPDGKYLLLKDPGKPTILLYQIPEGALEQEEQEEEIVDEET